MGSITDTKHQGRQRPQERHNERCADAFNQSRVINFYCILIGKRKFHNVYFTSHRIYDQAKLKTEPFLIDRNMLYSFKGKQVSNKCRNLKRRIYLQLVCWMTNQS